jgi:hypothetical protein
MWVRPLTIYLANALGTLGDVAPIDKVETGFLYSKQSYREIILASENGTCSVTGVLRTRRQSFTG